MDGKKKRAKTCGNGTQEDKISQLPNILISEILYHLPTKDAVRTSALSKRWRSLWLHGLGLDLTSSSFSDLNALTSCSNKFLYSCKVLWIRRLRLRLHHVDSEPYLSSWLYAATTHMIQHLDVQIEHSYNLVKLIPLNLIIYTCKTLVLLKLSRVGLVNVEYVSLPCLKNIHLEYMRLLHAATLEKLVSNSPVLEDLTLISCSTDHTENILQVHSHSLKRIHIYENTLVVIDAPLLQFFKTKINRFKNYKIISLDSSAKLDICCDYNRKYYKTSLIKEIITDISRVKNLVISNVLWKELVKIPFQRCKEDQSVKLSTVPTCMISSLKFVEWTRSIPRYEGEMKLVSYFLKNSRVLEKLKVDAHYTKKATCDIQKELLAMPRGSDICQVFFNC